VIVPGISGEVSSPFYSKPELKVKEKNNLKTYGRTHVTYGRLCMLSYLLLWQIYNKMPRLKRNVILFFEDKASSVSRENLFCTFMTSVLVPLSFHYNILHL
jgi:hypothetical protein